MPPIQKDPPKADKFFLLRQTRPRKNSMIDKQQSLNILRQVLNGLVYFMVNEMAEKPSEQIIIGQLRPEIRVPVEFLVTRLREDLGDDLQSLCVVGSALTEDFDPKRSDINTVLTVRRRTHPLLALLAGYGSKMGKMKLRAPLLMTPEYIQQSRDVFGVEFLDIQFNHAVIYGPDPFAGLTFRKEDVRLQCERQLKAALITLRQGYIRTLGKPKLVGELLLACVAELTVLLRAMLWLTDNERDRLALPTLQKAAETFEFDADKITTLMKLKLQHSRPEADQVESIFENTYQVVDLLARKMDQLQTKP
jgi:hypothetical protein